MYGTTSNELSVHLQKKDESKEKKENNTKERKAKEDNQYSWILI